MTEQLRQSLSAVIDGEADAFELRRVLDELERDPELRAAWDRYHLIGSVMRRERNPHSRSTAHALANRVPQAVRESSSGDGVASAGPGSPAVAGQPVAVRGRPGRRGAVGIAVAASVALAAVIAFLDFESLPGSAQPQLAVEPTALVPRQLVAGATVVDPAAVPGQPEIRLIAAPAIAPSFGQASPSDLRRAHAYMLQHAQQRGLEQSGVISLVKMATYEAP